MPRGRICGFIPNGCIWGHGCEKLDNSLKVNKTFVHAINFICHGVLAQAYGAGTFVSGGRAAEGACAARM